MINGKTVFALIPARGGSKGIKNKNIKPFCGLPLIAHTINQAKKVKHIDQIIVSTDSDNIKEIALKYGANVPFNRPANLSDDNATNIDVVLHAIEKFNSDIFILLQPTSPLRTSIDIDHSLQLLFKRQVKIVISTCKVKNYNFSFTLKSSGFISNSKKLNTLSTNRQDHEQYFSVNGAIYAAYSNYFSKSKSFFTPKTFSYEMPLSRSVDIDDMTDWEFAKKLFNQK
jgi:CMP-N,N'-diacetyllegionaminic acid synthase